MFATPWRLGFHVQLGVVVVTNLFLQPGIVLPFSKKVIRPAGETRLEIVAVMELLMR